MEECMNRLNKLGLDTEIWCDFLFDLGYDEINNILTEIEGK